MAVESFFENNDGENDEDDDFSPSSVQDREDLTDPISISKSTNTASQAPSINPQPRQSTINTNNKIFTLNSMRSDNNEEEGQAFYAGGSDQSGQQILGPPRQSHESIIKNLFSKAKEYESPLFKLFYKIKGIVLLNFIQPGAELKWSNLVQQALPVSPRFQEQVIV